jgi:putative transposase
MRNRARRRQCLSATGTDLHVYNRGVNQGTIFFTEGDYLDFLDLMRRWLENSGVIILLYTLMPNHFHLVVRQDHPYDISSYMKNVCERHAMKINGVRSRSGHLFQGRFKISRIIDPGALLQISHYIHFNATAAKLVRKHLDWAYSSAREYAGLTTPGLVTVQPILELIGGQEAYLRFLKEYDPHCPASVWKYLLRTVCH